jgi:hypothetical protein
MSTFEINFSIPTNFKVHYCEELIHRLFENLDNPHLTAIDRMGLFDDQVLVQQVWLTGVGIPNSVKI